MATCALCLKDVEVLIESHILPEFLYKDIYDEKHRFMVFSDRHDRPVMPIQQKGMRQPLLCQACETLFSRWERYASMVLYGGVELGQRDQPDHSEYHGLDYSPFKLFLMSILWRISVAQDQGFNGVLLTPEHLERLRFMLLAEDPGEEWEYGCILQSVPRDHEAFAKIIVTPAATPKKLFGHDCYVMVVAGLIWRFMVSDDMSSFPFRELFLTKDGMLQIGKPTAATSDLLHGLALPVASSNASFLSKMYGA